MDPTTTSALAGMTYEQFQKTAPAAAAALHAMGKAVDDSGLEKSLTELVKVRVSQINGCAFCVQLHCNLARRVGVDVAKLDRVAAWRDADVFSAREAAALGWAEEVTRLADHMPREAAYAALDAHFSADEAANLTVAVAHINAWNRIAGALRFPPPAVQGG